MFGKPDASSRHKVVLSSVTQSQVVDIDRKNDTVEKLAVGLLLLLFTHEELGRGNCTKPVRGDIEQLDSERLWAIKCNK